MADMERMADRLAYFTARYEPVTESGCWLWVGHTHTNGYGRLPPSRGRILAHRESWELHHGPIPAGMCVCHKCDTPTCVNPVHLFLGTIADNNADKGAKGRGVGIPGSLNATSKLTEDQVIAIRQDARTHREIAAAYGVDRTLISQVVKGQVWTHVPVAAKFQGLRCGSRRSDARVTEADVLKIRADHRPQREIALDYGITGSAVSKIRRRESWKHVA